MQKNSPKNLKKWAERQKIMRDQKFSIDGLSYSEIGKQWNISKQRAYQIVNGKTIEVVNK